MTQTQQDIIQKIETYEAREQSIRQRLGLVTDDKLRAALGRIDIQDSV
jgi:hypothetical protein